MNQIEGLERVSPFSMMGMERSAGMAEMAPLRGGGAAHHPGLSIHNDQGQSLIDIRDELKAAAKGALENFDGEGDFRGSVEQAIHGVLEENGFDPTEVKNAMTQRALPFSSTGGPSRGVDASTLFESEEAEEDLVQQFLEQFRAGTSLDVRG